MMEIVMAGMVGAMAVDVLILLDVVVVNNEREVL